MPGKGEVFMTGQVYRSSITLGILLSAFVPVPVAAADPEARTRELALLPKIRSWPRLTDRRSPYLGRFEGPFVVSAVSFAPVGTRIATLGQQHVRVFDYATGRHGLDFPA